MPYCGRQPDGWKKARDRKSPILWSERQLSCHIRDGCSIAGNPQFGEQEARQLAFANNTPPTTAFRVNTLRTSATEVITDLETKGVTTRESQVAPGAFVVESGPGSVLMEASRLGMIYVQDEASQLVSILLEPSGGQRVLDLCAAPGSKTTHIAALTDDKAWIIASDRHHHRLKTLRATCERLGVRSIDALALDATRWLPFVSGRGDSIASW